MSTEKKSLSNRMKTAKKSQVVSKAEIKGEKLASLASLRNISTKSHPFRLAGNHNQTVV